MKGKVESLYKISVMGKDIFRFYSRGVVHVNEMFELANNTLNFIMFIYKSKKGFISNCLLAGRVVGVEDSTHGVLPQSVSHEQATI